MRKLLFLSAMAAAVLGLMGAFASSALAFPTQNSLCMGCHTADWAVVVSATQVSNDGTNAVYMISVNSPYGTNGWGVFYASKVAGASGSGGNVTCAPSSSARASTRTPNATKASRYQQFKTKTRAGAARCRH